MAERRDPISLRHVKEREPCLQLIPLAIGRGRGKQRGSGKSRSPSTPASFYAREERKIPVFLHLHDGRKNRAEKKDTLLIMAIVFRR